VILVLDNYDSFTYNLSHYLEDLGAEFRVFRNDEISLDEADSYSAFLLSPGPGLPVEAGVMCDLINRFSGKKKILGVCLGMQALCENRGLKLVNMPHVLHGQQTDIEIINQSQLFTGLESRISVGRYHSWAIERSEIRKEFSCTAWDESGYAMAVEDEQSLLYGVQFHPESIMTPSGKKILENWLKI